MELTQTYKHKATVTDSGTSFQKFLLTFINKHADVFKALTRVGNPYGESIRSGANVSDITGFMPEKQIDSLQQQVDELSQTIASLSDQVQAHNVSARIDYKPSTATEAIGINRFRALQAEF